ncbi:MAG: hypothetical protein AAF546_00475 [Verrucomicrobiota bacterium]
MSNSSSTADTNSFPNGLYGYAVTDAGGNEIGQKGTISHSVNEFAPYFNQLAALVGDSLGFGETEEIVLFGKKQNALCIEIDGLHYGAIFKPKASYRDISEFLKLEGEENDVLA